MAWRADDFLCSAGEDELPCASYGHINPAVRAASIRPFHAQPRISQVHGAQGVLQVRVPIYTKSSQRRRAFSHKEFMQSRKGAAEQSLDGADIPLVGCLAYDTENLFTGGIENSSEEIREATGVTGTAGTAGERGGRRGGE